jgi:hypothetical protein
MHQRMRLATTTILTTGTESQLIISQTINRKRLGYFLIPGALYF